MGIIADKIRRAIFGGEVRDAIADGIEVVEQLREDYDRQVINAGNSNAEIVDARGGEAKLKDRLDKFGSSLEQKAEKITTANLQSQIDEIVSIGSGDSNPEVVQARINYTGKKFSTLKNNLDNIEFYNLNNLTYINEGEWEVGNIIGGVNYSQDTSLRTINSFSLEDRKRLILKNNDSRDCFIKIIFYTSDEIYISENQVLVTSYSNVEYAIPTNSKKARVSLGFKNVVDKHQTEWTKNIIIYTDNIIYNINSNINNIFDTINNFLLPDIRKYSDFTWENGSIIGGQDNSSSATYNIRSIGNTLNKSDNFSVTNNKSSDTIYIKLITYSPNGKLVEELINTFVSPGQTVKASPTKVFDNFRIQIGIKGNTKAIDSSFAKDIIFTYEKLKNPYSTFWSYKKWISYGDSLTGGVTWEWQPKVVEILKINTHGKRGMGGTTVSKFGSVANPFCDDTRINNNIDSDSELVTIFGGHNDWGQNCPLGDLTYPFDEYTFKGALASTIFKIQNKLTSNNAHIVIMTTANTRGLSSSPTENVNTPVKNSLGLTHGDYAKACKEVAEFMSVPYIDVYSECGINNLNRSKYCQDAVHPNELGFNKISQVVISGLKRIESTDI